VKYISFFVFFLYLCIVNRMNMQKTKNNPEYVAELNRKGYQGYRRDVIKKIPAKSTGGDSCFIDAVRVADR